MKIPAVMSGEPRSQIIAIEEFVTDLVFTHGSIDMLEIYAQIEVARGPNLEGAVAESVARLLSRRRIEIRGPEAGPRGRRPWVEILWRE